MLKKTFLYNSEEIIFNLEFCIWLHFRASMRAVLRHSDIKGLKKLPSFAPFFQKELEVGFP